MGALNIGNILHMYKGSKKISVEKDSGVVPWVLNLSNQAIMTTNYQK